MGNGLLEKPITFEVNGEDVKLTGNMVKQFLVSGSGEVTDQETVMFLNLCKYQHLNPFLKEAYLVKFGTTPAQIIVSKEAFMKRAEGHPQYDGFEAGIIVERGEELKEIEGAVKLPKDKLIGGWARVYRKDRRLPTISQISFDEFSKNQSIWKTMPNNMIRKTAIVNAMREAFPQELGSMYTEDDKNPVIQEAKPVEENKTIEKLETLISDEPVVTMEVDSEKVAKPVKPLKKAEPVLVNEDLDKEAADSFFESTFGRDEGVDDEPNDDLPF